jgi:2-polyprenyl-3-methyl-5-hydroxy-6-metoxy-1,4-benzoquinol methylase
MEEITVEKIRERIRDNLRRAEEQNFPANEPIKKLELVNVPDETIALGPKGIIRGIPLIGYLIWWAYMIIKAPIRISQLFAEVNELKSNDKAIETNMKKRLNEWIQNIPQLMQMSERLMPIRQQIDSSCIMVNSTIKSGHDIIPEMLFLDNLNACFHPTVYKNWDLGLFMRFILSHFGKTAWILDIGCVSNPLLFNLAGMGYLNLNGIDLHLPRESIYIHPQIRYIEADLTQTPYKDGQFDCITSLSVIEHGVDPESYFKEMSRILKSGGIIITSTDYWPDKIQTQDVPRTMTLGSPWNIFSKSEIIELISISERYGFKLLIPLEYTATERVVHYLGKAYTFIVFGLEKQRT